MCYCGRGRLTGRISHIVKYEYAFLWRVCNCIITQYHVAQQRDDKVCNNTKQGVSKPFDTPCI